MMVLTIRVSHLLPGLTLPLGVRIVPTFYLPYWSPPFHPSSAAHVPFASYQSYQLYPLQVGGKALR